MKTMDAAGLAALQKKADRMKQAVLNTENPGLSAVKGTVYYVSNAGSDDADGKTPETAFRTMARVQQALAPGDAALFRRGDLFRGHTFEIPDGVLVSAWGQGPKPAICGSLRNYADPALWKATEHPGIWACTVPMKNAGLITFDHDPRITGKYDVLCGWLVAPTVDFGDHSTYTFPEPPPLQLKNDLEFWTDDSTETLYLKSGENPGKRFREIEIASGYYGLQAWNRKHVVIDNLHITLMGKHGISGSDVTDFEVRNCILDYIGGSILWETCPFNPAWKNVRFGNAVEVYMECHGYRVFNNWIYQIYDTGITHQCNDKHDREIVMQDVEYHDNLIEYCYWAIEYYNRRNRRSITGHVRVHDNFCRFGGMGWGCKIRKEFTPMYTLSFDADETLDYMTENNIFEFSESKIIRIFGEKTDPSGFTFRHNTYIQKAGGQFADFSMGGKISGQVPYAGKEPETYLKTMFQETDAELYTVNPEDFHA